MDSTSSWSYATVAWRAANASNSNRITWVDGLGQSTVEAEYLCNSEGGGLIGIGFGSTTTTSGITAYNSALSFAVSTLARDHTIGLGLAYVQALEIASSGTATVFSGYGTPFNYGQALRASLEA